MNTTPLFPDEESIRDRLIDAIGRLGGPSIAEIAYDLMLPNEAFVDALALLVEPDRIVVRFEGDKPGSVAAYRLANPED